VVNTEQFGRLLGIQLRTGETRVWDHHAGQLVRFSLQKLAGLAIREPG
jgi:hypothetical protein